MTALELYYQNPKICQYCKNVIHVTDGRAHNARRKTFCSRSCATSYNNSKMPKRRAEKEGECSLCGVPVSFKRYSDGRYYRRRFCDVCYRTHGVPVAKATKASLFATRKTWQSARSAIQKHANSTYFSSKKEKACVVCGYDKHVEVAHIRPVSEFSPEATVEEINRLQNLAGLCPNHHWEHDNGLLELG